MQSLALERAKQFRVYDLGSGLKAELGKDFKRPAFENPFPGGSKSEGAQG